MEDVADPHASETPSVPAPPPLPPAAAAVPAAAAAAAPAIVGIVIGASRGGAVLAGAVAPRSRAPVTTDFDKSVLKAFKSVTKVMKLHGVCSTVDRCPRAAQDAVVTVSVTCEKGRGSARGR